MCPIKHYCYCQPHLHQWHRISVLVVFQFCLLTHFSFGCFICHTFWEIKKKGHLVQKDSIPTKKNLCHNNMCLFTPTLFQEAERNHLPWDVSCRSGNNLYLFTLKGFICCRTFRQFITIHKLSGKETEVSELKHVYTKHVVCKYTHGYMLELTMYQPFQLFSGCFRIDGKILFLHGKF